MTCCCQTASGQQINRIDDVHLSMTLCIYYVQNLMEYKIHRAKTPFCVKCFRDKYVVYKYNLGEGRVVELFFPKHVTGFLFNVEYILNIFYLFVEAPYISDCRNK